MSENIWISCAIVYNMIHTHNSLWTVLDQLVSVHTSEGVLKLSNNYWKAAKTSKCGYMLQYLMLITEWYDGNTCSRLRCSVTCSSAYYKINGSLKVINKWLINSLEAHWSMFKYNTMQHHKYANIHGYYPAIQLYLSYKILYLNYKTIIYLCQTSAKNMALTCTINCL